MALPFLTPIIVAAGTTFVGDYFQKQNNKIRIQRERRQAILTKAQSIYNEISKKIDTLYYYMRDESFFIAVRAAKEDKSRSTDDLSGWTKYEASMADWKSNQNRLISELEVYYGYELADLLDKIGILLHMSDSLICATYYKTGNSLVKKVENPAKGEREYDIAYGRVLDPLDQLKPFVRMLNRKMMEHLQSENVGDLRNLK